MELTLAEISKAIGAEKTAEQVIVNNIEFDARKITPGSLFIPLQGNRDGQEFIEQAIQNGAVAVLYRDEKYYQEEVPCLRVEDTTLALQRLAMHYLQKVQPIVLGITGSNGKTTTKDMTYAVVQTKYQAYKTMGNYNNELGLPYTILHMPSTTEVLVLEMGMDDFGQIELLSKIAKPDYAAITLIGESHLEQLGSREGIAKAKLEITSGLKAEGTLIVPADEPLLNNIELNQKVLTFSLKTNADINANIVKTTKDRTYFQINLDNEEWMIPVLGDYNVSNALIAIAFGRLLNIPLAAIRDGLAHFQLTNSRTEWLVATSGAELLSDVYNANPTAMKKVLENFAKITSNKTKVAVLGDMLELGPKSAELHASVATYLDPQQIEYVYLYGKEMQALATELASKYDKEHLRYFDIEQKEQLLEMLQQLLDEQTMAVFKASNGMRLIDLVTELTKKEQ